jgi:hypothetical protein
MSGATSTLIATCPKEDCNNKVWINRVYIQGGVNDKGSFKVKCNECDTEFQIAIGRDVELSSIQSGATLIEKVYDRD